MPKLSFSVEVPQSDFEQIEEIADLEGVTVRGLFVWLFKSDLALRAKQALATRQATEPDAA